ncbi:MAG TPA: hypothetical protein PKA60_02355 [Candidatus Paceibacterota bacterium]|nr:hypothetical protein [Candidatus Paceibacterota bacterium]
MAKNKTASIIKTIIAVLFVVGIVSYVFFNSRVLIAGPQIIIESPVNGQKIEGSQLIKISGTANNIAYFWLDDRQIYTDEEGNFSESLLLYPGYNIIWLTAKDKFDRSTSQKLELIY